MLHSTRELEHRWKHWCPIMPIDGEQLRVAIELVSDLMDAVRDRDRIIAQLKEEANAA